MSFLSSKEIQKEIETHTMNDHDGGGDEQGISRRIQKSETHGY